MRFLNDYARYYDQKLGNSVMALTERSSITWLSKEKWVRRTKKKGRIKIGVFFFIREGKR